MKPKELPGPEPIWSQDAEMATLGAMILEEKAIEDVRGILTSRDFFPTYHQDIFRAILFLNKMGVTVDLVTLKARLKENDKLKEVGGVEYLMQCAERVVSTSSALHYAQMVRDLGMARRLESALKTGLTEVVRNSDIEVPDKFTEIDKLIQSAMTSKSVSGFQSLKDLQKESVAEIEAIFDSGQVKTGVSTGFSDIDRQLGGLRGGHLYILAARPAMGKSSCAASIALNVASKGGPVVMFSLEMKARDVNDRLLACEAGINLQKLLGQVLEGNEIQDVYDASERLRDIPLFIDDSADQSVAAMKTKIRRLQAEKGKVSLVVVDYLQLLKASRRYDSRQVEVSDVARGLKTLARELDVPIIALCQLSRAVEQRNNKRPGLSDLRESGSLEAEADVVTFLYRPGYYKPKNTEQGEFQTATAEVCEMIVSKQRNGPTGTVLLGFVPAFTKFCLLAEESKEAYWANRRKKQ